VTAIADTPARSATTRRIALMGLELDPLTAEQTIDHIFGELAAGRGGWLLTPNLHILRKFALEPAYAAQVQHTTLRVADGMPLIWASRIRGTPLPERVAGSELIWTLSARAAREGRSVFFLGGNPGAADEAAAVLRERNPGLRVAGTDCPPKGFMDDSAYLGALERKLIDSRPDICYVGLPIGPSEVLIERFRPQLPQAWFAGIGISFSYVSGEVRHAPVMVRRVGLEWLYRLLQEPRRLGRRYLIEGFPFAARLLGSAVLGRIGVGR
jgi:N-acetylglucosaminyldiphosphoundecaprenol N-acetyl-beta-D-mannosaminyltransferase